jgi:hypothetical protein
VSDRVPAHLGKRIFPLIVAPTLFDDLPVELKAGFQIADISSPGKEAEGFERLAIGLRRAGLDSNSFCGGQGCGTVFNFLP